MNIDLEHLKNAAQEATPGPWRTGEFLPRETVYQSQVVIDTDIGPKVLMEGNSNFYDDAKRDTEFIAAANPAVILELVERLERAESDLAFQKQVTDAARQEQGTLLDRAERAESDDKRDAERWRAEMSLRNDKTAAIVFMGINKRCAIYRGGELYVAGKTYVEAIDAAITAKHN